MKEFIIILSVCVTLLLIYILLFNGCSKPITNNGDCRTPKGVFLDRTDPLWDRATMKYGSFDKIPKEEMDKIFIRMDEIAKEVGYDGFDLSFYI